jgi:hypothetical protein
MANKKLKLPNTKYAVVNMSDTVGDNTNSLDPLALFTTAYADKIIETVDFGGSGGTGGGDVTREQFNNEVQARKDGDATLTTKLNKEIQDRENAYTTLQNNINAEKTTRENADTTLTTNLNNEIQERENADATLQSNIDAEKTARENADTTLQDNIDDEVSARTTAIENVNSAIATERNARISADNSINQKLSQETNERKQANQTINNSINDYWKTIYPIGSIYISTSPTFNPQSTWGGVWTSIAEGRCLIGANDEYPLGSTGGEKTHTLLENELPKIEGNAIGVATYNSSRSGHFKVTKENPCNINAGSGTNDLSNMYFGFGDNLPHNNMQPYLAVYMWKRTA